MADQALMGTLTGEHFQPVRLHYRVLNHPGLKRAFEKLRCLEYDPPPGSAGYGSTNMRPRIFDSNDRMPSSRKSFVRS